MLPVHVAHRIRPMKGEDVAGDAALVHAKDDATLLAVIDGLGHGAPAALAALRARDVLLAAPALDPIALVRACDRALRGTRGAAMTLVVLTPEPDAMRVLAVGVGNVLLRASGIRDLAFASTPGIVGGLRREPRVARGRVDPRARIVLASDGVSTRFELDALSPTSPERACDELLERHAVDHDDATVLVADLVTR